jgi:hypothetical protein
MKTDSIHGLQEFLDQLGIDIDENMKVCTEMAAKGAVKQLKRSSRAAFGNGPYAKSWAKKKTRDGWVVYSRAPHYRLTHLLENGHYVVDRNGVMRGYKEGKPHIKPIEELSMEYIEKFWEEFIPRWK